MKSDERNVQLVLGFDGGCAFCTDLARQIESISAGQLTTRSLWDQDVQRWRQQTLGAEAPWTPALFAVGENRVRAWRHLGLAWQLTRRLGPRRMWQIARLLGESTSPRDAVANPGRRRAIKALAGAATGLTLLSGKAILSPLAALAAERGIRITVLSDTALAATIEQARREPATTQLWQEATARGYTAELGQARGVEVRDDRGSVTQLTIPFSDTRGNQAQIIYVARGQQIQVGLGFVERAEDRVARIPVYEIRDDRLVQATTLSWDVNGTMTIRNEGDGSVVTIPRREQSGGAGATQSAAASSDCDTCLYVANQIVGVSCGIGAYFACVGICAFVASLACPFICGVVFIIYCGNQAYFTPGPVCQSLGYC